MRQSLLSINFFKSRIILSYVTIIFMILSIFIGYIFISKGKGNIYQELNYTTLGLIVLVVVAVLLLMWFLIKQLTRDMEAVNLEVSDTMAELELKLENALKISEYKSIYLENVSYEVRTPLNTLMGMLQMLKLSSLDEEQMVKLEMAELSSEQILQLVNMIIDNTNVSSEQLKLSLKAMDLKVDLSKLIKVFEYQAWDKRLEFEFRFLEEKDNSFFLLGDLKRIEQVLINLMNNALNNTNSGKVSLLIDQTVNGDNDSQIVTFYIKDTGNGLHQDKIKKILGDFEKSDVFANDEDHIGLGLPISYKLVKLMGGELELESKEGEGSIFYFSLQLKKTLSLKREQDVPNSILLNQFDYKFSVLVAEDNKMNQKAIKFLLEQQGVDCTFVKNGKEAIELYKILDFDMIFMDIFMPEMDGYDATKLIKSSAKYAAHNIPIIAVSASAFDEDIANAKLAGIDHFLAKPIETEKLKELLVTYAPKEKLV